MSAGCQFCIEIRQIHASGAKVLDLEFDESPRRPAGDGAEDHRNPSVFSLASVLLLFLCSQVSFSLNDNQPQDRQGMTVQHQICQHVSSA